MNFRVEAGIATTFERCLDGLVGGVVLMLLIYISARFFNLIEVADGKGLFSCCDGEKKEWNEGKNSIKDIMSSS